MGGIELILPGPLGHYYHLVNQKWRKGYEVELTHTGRQVSEPTLSHVIVVSISGNILDYQVQSKLKTLDGIVPSSHRFMIGTTGMRSAWLSTEHQTILWCNQVVVQISHTLLSLIDPKIGQPFPSTQKRLTVFTKMLRSEMPPSFNWMREVKSSIGSIQIPLEGGKSATGTCTHDFSPCPQSVHWNDDGLERDLYIQGPTVTVLAMDGRRRWLDILKLGSDGKNYFAFVTNLAPCSGVRLHLWPEKSKMASDTSPSKGVVEVTSKMVEIPAGPAPIQIEPGSQTEQPPPSAVLQLGPEDMRGFRFLTISVAPRKLGDNLQGLCRLRCFPPVAIAWDSTSGLHVIPNLYSETISVDSSPAFWDSTQESDMTTVLLLLDPHCSFTIGAGVSVTTAAGRFLLLYCSEVLRIIRGNLTVTIALVSVILVCFVHPALGLLILLLSHALHSHTALCSHARKREFDSKTKVALGKSNFKPNSGFDPLLPLEEKSPNNPNSTRSYGDTQIKTFNHRHGLLMLHLLAVLMFVPFFVAWFQDIEPFQEMSKYVTFVNGNRVFTSSRWTRCHSPWSYNFISFPFLHIQGQQVGLSIVYMLAGFYCYLSGLALAPYRAFYAMAAVGVQRLDFGTGNSFFRFFGDTVILGGNVDITPAEARVSKPLKSLAHPKYISSSRSSITKSTYYLKTGRHLEMDPTTDFTNTQPYVSSPFTLPPFDSLAPLPLPQNTPYCENPPSIPQPPTQIPTPMIYTTPPPPPTTSYSAPIVPAQNPPPSPTFDVPSPPECSPSPNPPEYGPSPPSFSPETPGTPEYVPTPPDYYVPGPPETVPSTPGYEPSPPIYIPSPSSFTPSPPETGTPGYVPIPPIYIPSPSGYTPSPVFQPPVIYPPPSVPPLPYKGPHYALWCVVKPSVPDPIIQEAMNYACGSGANSIGRGRRWQEGRDFGSTGHAGSDGPKFRRVQFYLLLTEIISSCFHTITFQRRRL
ncbi:hypothetical protein IFM89_008743 [Coptis chinensis]|uniref:X8 domain-containing protein n=1 Tax=Coptis chinensis TaxID=261450 RepID=A0A835HL86_9MAGN|nr:hypothetical protein IFM89_008743 [Coptis chinensis]